MIIQVYVVRSLVVASWQLGARREVHGRCYDQDEYVVFSNWCNRRGV